MSKEKRSCLNCGFNSIFKVIDPPSINCLVWSFRLNEIEFATNIGEKTPCCALHCYKGEEFIIDKIQPIINNITQQNNKK